MKAYLTSRSLSMVIGFFVLALSFATLPRRVGSQTSGMVAVVSAASYQREAPLASESIASIFGLRLATTTAAGRDADPTTPGVQLPTTLGGTTVEINGQRAGLFYVSPAQINFMLPAGTAIGAATVTVRASDGALSMGTINVAAAAPGIFTYNAQGTGVPAAILLRVAGNGALSYDTIAQLNTQNVWVPKPIVFNAANERLFLILYLSGIRGALDLNRDGNVNEHIHLKIGGLEVKPDWVGRQGDFAGLDQLNYELPRSFNGRGPLQVSVNYAEQVNSNVAEIAVGGVSDQPDPVRIGILSPTEISCGEELTVNGANFAASANSNEVFVVDADGKALPAVVKANSTTTQLRVIVPFGAGSGSVLVRTPQNGQAMSSAKFTLRTSLSGIVESADGQPLVGVPVNETVTPANTRTSAEGAFILAGLRLGLSNELEIIPPVSAGLPYPKYTTKLRLTNGRDRHLGRIALTQQTGPTLSFPLPTATPVVTVGLAAKAALAPEQTQPALTTSGISFFVAGNTTAVFPDGAVTGRIQLDRVPNSRTPAPLPPGVFSSAIAQLAPFGVKLTPGGKFSFPNDDTLPVNAQPKLYKLDQTRGSATLGEFIEVGAATVSADGRTVETAANAITETSIYFVAVRRPLTTVTGRVVESDGKPVRLAQITVRGQQTFTDGLGQYVLPNVAVTNAADLLTVEASFQRPTGRVDRVSRANITPVLNGATVVADLVLPSAVNRPPTLIAPPTVAVTEGVTLNLPLAVSDPDGGALTVTVTGAAFATIVQSSGAYSLRLAPGAATAGLYFLQVRVADSQNLATTKQVTVTVSANRPPVLSVPGAQTAQAGQTLSFTVSAIDPDAGQTLTYSATGLPSGASFNPATRQFSWAPSAAQIGSVTVSFRVSDNGLVSLSGTKTVTISVIGQFAQTNGPYGGYIQALLVNGTNLFAGTATGGVFLSTNNGQSWTAVNNGLTNQFVLALAVSGSNLFAGTNGGVFLSTNNGQSWTRVSNGLPSLFVDALLVSGSNLFAGTDGGGVFLSTNNGQSWTAANNGLTSQQVHALAVSGSNLFAGTFGGGVFLSTNNGQSWSAVNNGLTDQFVQAFTMSGSNLFAGTFSGGVFLSTNNGQSWTAVNNGLTTPQVYALAVSGSNLFAGTNSGGVFLSTNNGQSWTRVSNDLPFQTVLALAVSGSNLIAGTAGSGVYLSINNGQNWAAINNGLTNHLVQALAVSGSNLFAGTGGGVYLSTNNGQSWMGMSNALTGQFVTALTVSGSNLYAGAGGGVFLSTNNGQSWTAINNGLSFQQVSALVVSGSNLFAGTDGGGVFLSTNNGQSWTAVNNGLTEQHVYALAVNGSNLFAGTFGGGVFLSTNNGQSWAAVNNGLTNQLVTALTVSGSNLFAGTFGGVFLSTNNGQSWTAVNNGLTNRVVFALAVSGSNLFAGVGNFLGGGIGGVFLSTNSGQSWTAVNNGLPDQDVFALAVSGNRIFAGTRGSSVLVAQF